MRTLTRVVSLANPISQLCSQAQFEEPVFMEWMGELNLPRRYWRKQWEFAYICQTLANADMLENGRSALGFGVGTEPLPALFASYGVKVVATDQKTGGTWARTGQFSGGIHDLPYESICSANDFYNHVTHQAADMNNIPADLRQGEFDFVWSTNSLDHLGSIENGLAFIEASLDCLKPGGLAIHTTEFNLDSNSDTIKTGEIVLFRECDIKGLAGKLTKAGHGIAVNLERGNDPYDLIVDKPPYDFSNPDSLHIRLIVGGYTITAVGLIIRKGGAQ